MTSRRLRALVASLLIGLVPGIVPAASARDAKAPRIHFLNPSPAYNPDADMTGSSATPAVSDRADGTDGLYRLVAWGSDIPSGTRVVAALRMGDVETALGEMTMSTARRDTWELLWDVPDDLPSGAATMIVKVVRPEGPTIARDEVDVRLRHQASGSAVNMNPGPDQSVGVTWPKVGGSLGFYRKPGGLWTTVLDGVTSEGTAQLQAFYSISTPGTAPEYAFCGTVDAQPQIAPYAFQMACELQGDATPKQVTAVGFVALGTYEDGGQTEGVGLTQESADVVRTDGVVQSPRDMTLEVARYGRALVNQCAGLVVTVVDEDGRPVLGANVDVHLKGPEGSGFATGSQSSGSKAPDAGKHEVAPTTNCSGSAAGEQGVHAAPEGERPIFHRESTDGSGLSGPDGVAPGAWRFDAYSTAPGFADVTVWLDEARSGAGTDDDVIGENEVAVSSRLQWLPVAPSITIDSLTGNAATSDGCVPFLARVRAGDVAVPGANVDLTATGPKDEVAFCSPPGAADVWRSDPPQAGTSQTGPPVRAIEGDADGRGNLLFGVTSSTGGDTALAAWFDGETGTDNDVRATSEPRATRKFSWAANESDVKLGFLNPSPFGGMSAGGGQGTQLLPGDRVDVSVTANVPEFVSHLRLSVSSDGGLNFFEIGTPQRVPGTDVFRTSWKVDLPRGDHVMRVEAADSGIFTDVAVQVGVPGAVDTSTAPYETAHITVPAPGDKTSFTEGATTISGTASPGADGVDLFYTSVAGGVSPQIADWIYCGYVDLDGTGISDQVFEGTCTLAAGERVWNVSGIAALAADCQALPGCDASPTGGGPAGRIAVKDSGDAVRIYGREAAPTLAVELPATRGRVDTCHPVTVIATDSTGGLVPDRTVDLKVQGRGARLCGERGTGSDHVKVTTLLDGSATVDIISDSVGKTLITAWLDANDDGDVDTTEASVTQEFRWKVHS